MESGQWETNITAQGKPLVSTRCFIPAKVKDRNSSPAGDRASSEKAASDIAAHDWVVAHKDHAPDDVMAERLAIHPFNFSGSVQYKTRLLALHLLEVERRR